MGTITAADDLANQGEQPLLLSQRVTERERPEPMQLEPHRSSEQRVGYSERRLGTVANALLQRCNHVAHRLCR